jgi:adenylate cyclase
VSESLTIPLDSIPGCFEGIIPAAIATVGDDGMPNVTYLSVVHKIDDNHVALSRQFFKKTDENTAVNPLAQVGLIDPDTCRQYLLDLEFERSETEGTRFERMRTRLDAVAAHEGMTNIFALRSVDICRVTACELLPGDYDESPARRDVSLEKVEAISRRIADASDYDEVLRIAMESCEELLGFPHAFMMLIDETGDRLYTVASTGFAAPGTGSEIRIGEGVIGLAAARRQTIRLTNMTRDLNYSHAARDAVMRDAGRAPIEQVIPLPGLPAVRSQLVTPMLAYHHLAGVICLQSPEPGAFQAADECVVGILASQVAMAMASLRPEGGARTETAAAEAGRAVQVKHYAEDDSVFLDNEYLIKGVAGGILWRLLRNHQEHQRSEFSNKEIRLDQTLDLPDIKDNLEARLILLRKRLDERCDYLRMEKTGRGRFRLVVSRPITLVDMKGGGPL